MNHIAFDRAGHRDGSFVFTPSMAEREDYQVPFEEPPSFLLTAGTFLLAVAPVLAFIAWWLS